MLHLNRRSYAAIAEHNEQEVSSGSRVQKTATVPSMQNIVTRSQLVPFKTGTENSYFWPNSYFFLFTSQYQSYVKPTERILFSSLIEFYQGATMTINC